MQLPPLMRLKAIRYAALLSSALLSGVAVVSIQRGLAQSPPACDPPSANEYLLLVTNQQSGTEEQLRQLLPANAAITSCQYLDDQVVRIGGFANAEIADAWAKYVTESTGLQAFVTGPTSGSTTAATATTTETATAPAESTPSSEATNFPTPTQVPSTGGTSSPAPTPAPTETTSAQGNSSSLPSLNQTPSPSTAPSTPSTTPSPVAPTPSPSVSPGTPTSPGETNVTTAPSGPNSNPSFNPKPLGSGYAVLVNYANRPEVAADVHQVTSQPVGLVSYNQRPFLLATYTTDPTAATAVLQSLNDRGFNAIIIDSRSAILLTPAVVGTGG